MSPVVMNLHTKKGEKYKNASRRNKKRLEGTKHEQPVPKNKQVKTPESEKIEAFFFLTKNRIKAKMQ